MIKTGMASKRALYYAEDVGGGQYRLRIQDSDPFDIKQWWTFDSRTHTIRAVGDRKLAISFVRGADNWSHSGYEAFAREYVGETIQQVRWFGGNKQNIRDLGSRCLDVHGGYDHNQRHVIFWACHNGLNQAWITERKGNKYPAYPLADNVKFQIRSKMQGGKALFWSENIGDDQFRLRIQGHDPENEKQWWTFDSRTKTIRPLLKKDFVLANQKGKGFAIDVAVVIRKYTGDQTEKIRWISGSFQNIKNNGHKCLDVHGGANDHNRHVIFYNCHNGLNQAWYLDQSTGSFNKQPFDDGVKFQIRSGMASSRVAYVAENIGGDQFILRIRTSKVYDSNQWFVFDSRTRSVRQAKKRTFAISNRSGYGFAVDNYVVARKWIDESYQKLSYFPGPKQNFQNPSGKCLDVHGGSDTENRWIIFWFCHDGSNQAWTLD